MHTAMSWPALPFDAWRATCDTLHAHAQVLGKLAVALAPPEPQLQHARSAAERARLGDPSAAGARRLRRARGRARSAQPRSRGRAQRRTRSARRAHAGPAGRRGHARGARRGARPGRSRRDQHHPAGDAVDDAARRGHRARHATTPPRSPTTSRRPRRPRSCSRPCELRIAAARRRSTRGGDRSTSRSASSPVSRSTRRRRTSSCATPGTRSRSRSAGGPGDDRHPRAAFYAYAYPPPEGFADGTLSPASAHWDAALGEYILDWDDVRSGEDPHGAALSFARSAVAHGCRVCGWNPPLAASVEGDPPPIR